MINSFTGEYSFLSNFYPSPILYDGYEYPTVEHAYQAAKTHDPATRKQIRDAETPAKAKRLGKSVALRKDWEQVKVNVMSELVLQKFARHIELGDKLCDTGTEHLEEGNTWGDRFWGTVDGEGKNMLGKILMKVRAIVVELD